MVIIDYDKQTSVRTIGLYLTVPEAEILKEELSKLLENPESSDHFHVYQEANTREISCSIITEKKLRNIKKYNKLEQQLLLEDSKEEVKT
jgi:hypothetical protein